MKKQKYGAPEVLSVIAVLISSLSLAISYFSYKEATSTNFSIKVEPSYYSSLSLNYFPKDIVPGLEIELNREGKAVLPGPMPSNPRHEMASSATITFPIIIRVTNNGRRALPIKRGYYFLLNKSAKTSEPKMNLIHLTEASKPDQKDAASIINIPPGEAKALHGEASVSVEGRIAEELKDIFGKSYSVFGKSLGSPSLARLNFYAISSSELKEKEGNPYPHLSAEFIDNYALLVGIEDLTGSHQQQRVDLTFPFNKFFSFALAVPGETTGLIMHPDQRSNLGLSPSRKDNKSVIIENRVVLSYLYNLIASREALCCNPDGSLLASPCESKASKTETAHSDSRCKGERPNIH